MYRIVTVFLSCLLFAQAAAAEDDINNFFPLDGFYVDARYRYEHVEQDNLTRNANASTLRLKAGYKTGTYRGLQGLVEFDAVGNIGKEKYNNTVNGKGTYPVIADPDGVELNQLWLSYAGLPDTLIKAGRQGINIDNQRFIGTVGWRQNDQTFDAITLSNGSISGLDLMYGHVRNVNRIFSDQHPLGDFDTETHIAHAAYKFFDWLTLAGYGYWLDIDLAPASSSRTYGLRATGKSPVNEKWNFFYEAEIAEQDDHAHNPNSYDATYYHLSPGFTRQNLTLQAGIESLEGSGNNRAFQTPLATLHAFNGWADQFLTTPPNGLEDLYGRVVYKFENVHPWLNSTVFTGAYHKFDAENGGMDYGDEWDLQLSRPLNLDNQGWSEDASITLKFADYDADNFSTDTQKWWVVFQVRF